MHRTLTEAMAYDHIADMQREAVTLRVAAAARGATHGPRIVRWTTRLRVAAGSANTRILTIRRRVAGA